jgi:hypothetical protein
MTAVFSIRSLNFVSFGILDSTTRQFQLTVAQPLVPKYSRATLDRSSAPPKTSLPFELHSTWPVTKGFSEAPPTPGKRKTTDSRDTEGSTIRGAAEFGEAVFTCPGKASRDRLIAEPVTAHNYGQIEVASFLRLHYSTISRILTADKRANIKT